MSFWVSLLVALVLGGLIGHNKSPVVYKIFAIFVAAVVYAALQKYLMGDVELSRPSSSAIVDFVGRVTLFAVCALGAGAVTNALLVSESKPR